MTKLPAQQIFVNLPVKDLRKSMAFFTKLRFSFDKQFTDKNAACLMIGKNIFAMLIVEKTFQTFTKKRISDAKRSTEVLLALQLGSRSAVDAVVNKALKAGGALYSNKQDHGWMYSRGFADLDGHQWEAFWMNEKKAPKKP